jgi:multiple RNA-binding domain-containing protein 1
LVRNISYGTIIRVLFELHGEQNRVLVAPAGTMAVVEFERQDETVHIIGLPVATPSFTIVLIVPRKGPLGLGDVR